MNAQRSYIGPHRPFPLALALCVALVALVSLFLGGCASAPSAGPGQPLNSSAKAPFLGSPTVQALGPTVASAIEARVIAGRVAKNPARAAMYLAVADSLGELTSNTSGAEITDLVIRAFVARLATKWGLLPGEDVLIVALLTEARGLYLANTGAPSVYLSDERVRVWVRAIEDGIRNGVAYAAAKGGANNSRSDPGHCTVPTRARTSDEGEATTAPGLSVCRPEHLQRADRGNLSVA